MKKYIAFFEISAKIFEWLSIFFTLMSLPDSMTRLRYKLKDVTIIPYGKLFHRVKVADRA